MEDFLLGMITITTLAKLLKFKEESQNLNVVDVASAMVFACFITTSNIIRLAAYYQQI